MKVIYLREDTFNKLLTIQEDIPFLDFYERVTMFVKMLLKDPIHAKPDETLCGIGLYNGILRQKLIDYDVIEKKEDIDEPYDEVSHKKISKYHLQYKVHRNNYKEKLRRLYNDLSNSNNYEENN